MIELNAAKQGGEITTSFVSVEEFSDGKYSIEFFSKYSGAKNPDELRRNFQIILNEEQLKIFAKKIGVEIERGKPNGGISRSD